MSPSTIIAGLKNGVTTNSLEATLTTAASLALIIPPNTTLALHGDLGAGKTAFVRGMARAWGITENINSPTFNILFVHQSKQRTLVHMDAFRMEENSSLTDLMLEDLLSPPWCLAVEWAEKLKDSLPRPVWHINITQISETERKFELDI